VRSTLGVYSGGLIFYFCENK